MKYKISNQLIPQEQRKDINEKLLYLIDNKLTDEYGITQEDVFNSYTGEGALHGLNFGDFNSFYDYTEAKKQQEKGQFFTPHALSKFIVDCLKPSINDLIGDPCSGMGNFFNYLPNEQNIYSNELDMKAFKISSFLYPNAYLTHGDVRFYNPKTQLDLIIGNPPFNLKFQVDGSDIVSQLFFCIKSHELLKPSGLMALIVPKSFLNDDFTDSGMIKQMNAMFNFVAQFNLPTDQFKQFGVNKFETKVMLFQKKSEHLEDKPYTITYIESPYFDETGSQQFYNDYVKPLIAEKQNVKAKLMLEAIKNGRVDEEFNYKVKKLLFAIKDNPKTVKHYAKCEEYLNKLYTQKQPEGMEYTEWAKKRVTENKVIRYLKDTLKKQHKQEVDKTELVRTRYGLKYKAYSRKEKVLLGKMNGIKEITWNEMIIKGDYPFTNEKYKRIYNKKLKSYVNQSQNLDEIKPSEEIKKYLSNLVIKDEVNSNEIKLNDIQKQDTGRMLMKQYGYLQWGTGSGKSISAIAQMLYRLEHSNIENVFLVAPAIAINNNWDDILKSYGIPYIRIRKLADIDKIKQGQIVIMTFNVVTKYKKQLKSLIRIQNQKTMFVLDEADSICNPSSKRTKAVLDCFRRVKYKLLMSATSTRNNIPESFTAFELLYNNSHNLMCQIPFVLSEDKKSKELVEKENKYYMKPFPAYKKGHKLFKKSFSPEKATVFGVGKQNQDIYNSDELKQLINKTMITRSFEEVSGKQLYKVVQNTVRFNSSENELYRVIIEEFHRLAHMFKSTGNSRKDSLLRIINQLNSLLKACVTPNTFKDYTGSGLPSKATKTIDMVRGWNDEIVAIGCTHVKAVNQYASYLRNAFPDRKVFVITGDNANLDQRKKIIEKLKESGNGILISTQQSLSSSMNIDFVNRVLILEYFFNFASHHQYFARFIRYTSTEQKEVHFLSVESSIESNLLSLLMAKEKLNSFMKNDEIDTEEVMERFGVDFDILSMLMSKETDEEGKSYIQWGKQNVI
ncbi:DEAD/DEAH box helicase [Alkalihalobacillus sp. NPDC078783]